MEKAYRKDGEKMEKAYRKDGERMDNHWKNLQREESVQKSVSKGKAINDSTFDIWKKRKKPIDNDWKI